MALELDFDLETLVRPISEESPCGNAPAEDSFDSPLIVVRGACRDALRFEKTAREKESDPDVDGAPSEWTDALNEWRKARDVSLKLIAEEWKDLEIVSFLIQALSRTDGFEGVAFGYELAAELVEQHFAIFYQSWGENVNSAMKPFAQLNSVLPNTLRRLPVTDDMQYSFLQFTVASKLDGLDEEERSRQMARGAVSRIAFMEDVEKSSEEFYQGLVASLRACSANVKRFSEICYEKLNEYEQLPAYASSGQIEEILDDILQLIHEVAENKLRTPEDEPDVEGDSADESANADASTPGQASGGGEIRRPKSRDEAFRLLDYAAEYFERNEPQSLLPSQIRRVIRQGTLTPKDLLSEILDDRSARDQLFRLVGIEFEPEDSGY